jgi:uncharacterized protein (DUF362 family)
MTRREAGCPAARGCTRREFLGVAAGCGLLAACGAWSCVRQRAGAEVFVAKAAGYGADIAGAIVAGMRELGIARAEVAGRRILLKPNIVEPRRGTEHVTTHPAVVLGAAEAFRRLGAAEVRVGEASGHCRDTVRVLEESGVGEALRGERVPFVDLNQDAWVDVANAGGAPGLAGFALPRAVAGADWVVPIAKMKTHHWAGVTLTMKNLFGALPGTLYGWPKNVLHVAGIHRCAADLAATIRPRFAIVDGIVGMEGDGPIMGAPKRAGVLVMGRDAATVDATAARIMGVDPWKIGYLALAADRGAALRERQIGQRGEEPAAVASRFALDPAIAAHRGIAL